MKQAGLAVVLFLLFLGIPGISSAQDQAMENYESANTFYAQKNYDQAIHFFEAAIDANPRFWQAFQGLGNCYYAMGDQTKALTSYQRALSLHPDNPSLSSFVQSLRTNLEAPQTVTQDNASADDKEKAWRENSGLSQAHFELSPAGGIAFQTSGSNLGFGAGLSGFYMLDNEIGLGALARLYMFNSADESATSLELVPAAKYKVRGKVIRPYAVGGIGLTVLADTLTSPGVGSIADTSYAPSQIFPVLEFGGGLEYSLHPDTSLFLEVRVDLILGNGGTSSYIPIEGGLDFTL